MVFVKHAIWKSWTHKKITYIVSFGWKWSPMACCSITGEHLGIKLVCGLQGWNNPCFLEFWHCSASQVVAILGWT